MIERLQRALEHVDELSPDEQEDIAQLIEEMTEPLEATPEEKDISTDKNLSKSMRAALAAIGSWRRLQDDDEFAALDRIRHESKPTPPVDEQLAWLPA